MSTHVSLDDGNHVLFTGWGPPHSSSHQGKSCCCSYNVSECQKVSFPIAPSYTAHNTKKWLRIKESSSYVFPFLTRFQFQLRNLEVNNCGEICCKCKSSFGQSWTSPPVIAQMSWDLQPQSGKLRVNII